MCATPPTVLNRFFRNLAHAFVMVCRCAYGLALTLRLCFVSFPLEYYYENVKKAGIMWDEQ